MKSRVSMTDSTTYLNRICIILFYSVKVNLFREFQRNFQAMSEKKSCCLRASTVVFFEM